MIVRFNVDLQASSDKPEDFTPTLDANTVEPTIDVGLITEGTAIAGVTPPAGANPISLSQSFLTNISALYRTTVFQTEDSGNPEDLDTFSYAGGNSRYSFGLLQFDVAPNSSAASLLENSGFFSDAQIAQLGQHGGLSQSQLGTLDTALQDYLDSGGQAQVDSLVGQSIGRYESSLQNDLQQAITADPGIAASLYSDPVALQNALDFFNQYGAATSLNAFQNFLQGDAIHISGGDPVQWDSGMTAEQNVQAFILATPYAVQNPTIEADREQRFDGVIGTEQISPTDLAGCGNSAFQSGCDTIHCRG